MVFRMFSALMALTIAAGFLGWVKSQTRPSGQTSLDEIFSATAMFPSSVKKPKSFRQNVAEALR